MMISKVPRRTSVKRKCIQIKFKSSTTLSSPATQASTTKSLSLLSSQTVPATAKKSSSTTIFVKCRKCDNAQYETDSSFEYPKIWEELRNKNQLCDGIIVCSDNVRFNIHRIIMAAVSPYFRALFTNSINPGEPEISKANTTISSTIFQVILDYAYTGNCKLDEMNVFDVLKYADQYQILDIISKCYQFLIDNLSYKNCLHVLKFANQFSCENLRRTVYTYILQHFSKIYLNNEDFHNIPLEQFKSILYDDYLNVKNEEIVFDAIKSWINYQPDVRKYHIFDLIKCVRLGNLSIEQIEYIAQWIHVQQDTICTLYITDIIAIVREFKETGIDPVNVYVTRSRIPYDILFAVGGWSAGNPTNFIESYDNRAKKWTVSKDTDTIARAYHGLCTFNNKIYLIGGFNGHEYFNTVRCYNPADHIWTDCSCMYYSRCYVSVALCKKKIYAIGGFNGRIRMNSAERFDPYKNQWQLIPSMQKQRSDASAAVLNDQIYIVGGFSGQEVMNSAEIFDPLTNQWTFIPSMISARSGVSLIAFNNALYAIGGFNGYTRLPTTEKFTPDSSRWIILAEMMTPRSNFGTVILDDCIYVIGGFNGSTTINYVEYYDPEINRWFYSTSMNLNRSALNACVISGLPNCKDFSYLNHDQNLIHDQHEIGHNRLRKI